MARQEWWDVGRGEHSDYVCALEEIVVERLIVGSTLEDHARKAKG